MKKKRPAATATEERGERPAFAASFPPDADLDALVDAFQRGDYATVREGVPRLVERSADEQVRAAALALRARIEPDPLGKTLIVVAALLLAFLAWWYLAHAHGPT